MKWASSLLLAWTLTVTAVTADVTNTTVSFEVTDPKGNIVLTSALTVLNGTAPQAIYDILRARFNQAVAQGQAVAPKPATITNGLTITNEVFPP